MFPTPLVFRAALCMMPPMIDAVVILRYRALRDIRFEPRSLTLVTGANGVGKSSLYRALTLLQRAASGGLGLALAKEGGIESVTWAGVSAASARSAEVAGRPIQGTAHKENSEVRLGLRTGGIGFELYLGMPNFDPSSRSEFVRDPGVLRESIWVGERRTRQSLCMEREGMAATCSDKNGERRTYADLSTTESAVALLREPALLPELHILRESLQQWRFYDGFRVDDESPLRQPSIGVRTPNLASDGSDLAACIQTILEVGDGEGFQESVKEGLGADIEVDVTPGPRFEVNTRSPGVLRPLRAHELSDGTLRYLALTAALYSPRLAPVLVFNEPESSLHPALLEPLGRAIADASRRTQVWVVTHSDVLSSVLRSEVEELADIELHRGDDGAAFIKGQRLLEQPAWP